MDYTKPPLSIRQQVANLKDYGLQIDNERLAEDYLSNIGYYRLKSYMEPFFANSESGYKVIDSDIRFSDIIELYCFDRRLRLLMFNAIEKIEVAVRAKIVQTYAEATNNSHWFCEKCLYFDKEKIDKKGNSTTVFDGLMDDIEWEVKRSKEDFIKQYKERYENPSMPPAWMTLEVLSIGTLSRLYKQLKKSPQKKYIAEQFGLKDDQILANWLYAISVWRNLCAHHSRVWNRRSIINVQLPNQTKYPFLDSKTRISLRTNKVFTVLCCIKYISNIISPQSDLKQNICSIIKQGGKLLNIHNMGFPKKWETLDVWK